MHKLTSGALVVALTGTAVTVPATINPTAHYAEAQGLLGLGGQALQGLVEKGEAKVAELESQLWKADLALKGAQAVLEMKRWGVALAIGEENKKAKQAEYDQQKLLVDSAELLVRTTKTSLDAARKTLAVTKKQLEDFNGKDPSAYEDAPEPDTKPLTLPTNLREALESVTAQQEAVAKRQALFDEADSAYTKRKKEVDSSWFSWLAPSNTKELEGLKNRRDARKAKLDLEQARLDNITRSIELFEAVEAETPAYEGHGADRYDATTPTNVDDASRQLEFANSTLEAATHRKANIEANLAALTGWQERNPFTGFWHNADKWTLERALRAADNEIADATKRIADKAAALEELKNAPAETEAVEPSAPEVETPSEVVEPSADAEPTEDSAPLTPEPSAPEAAPEPSESEAPTEPESPATSSEESAATSTPATTSTSAPEESAPRTPEASESVEPADTSAKPEDQIDIDELTHNLDEAKKLEQDMLDLQKLLQQYINKPEAETTEPSETEVSPTTVTEVSAATSAPATTAAPASSEVSAARTTEETEPAAEDSAARTTEETAPTADSSAARTTPTEIPSSEQSAPRTTTSAKLSTVAVAPTTSSEVSAARTTEAAKPTTEVSAAASAPATTAAPTSSEVSAARTTPTEIPSSQQSAPRTTEAAKPTTEVSAATPAPATTSTPTSEVSAARTTEETEPTAEDSAPRTTEAAKPTTEVSAATSTPATRPGSSAPRTTSQAPETTQQAKPTQQTEGAASGAEGSSASSWLWLILPLLLALGFGGAAYADLIPGVRLPRM